MLYLQDTDKARKDMVKECRDCGETKILALFHTNRNGFRANCKECRSVKDRRDKLLRFYNITPETYAELLRKQDGVCRICKQPESLIDTRTGFAMALAVDHDHSCCPGEKTCGNCIRGLLCARCNTAIGLMDDDVDLLLQSILYLRSTNV